MASVVEAIRKEIEDKPLIGVFHSLSALIALLFMQAWNGTPTRNGFQAPLLFDPPLLKPNITPTEFGDLTSAVVKRRRWRFGSHAEFADLYRAAPYFRRLVPGALELMAKSTLRPLQGTGSGYELRCPREYEAQVLQYMHGWALQVEFCNISCPVKVVGADPTERFSFLPSQDLSELSDIDYDFVPETTHFLQIENPVSCYVHTIRFIERLGV